MCICYPLDAVECSSISICMIVIYWHTHTAYTHTPWLRADYLDTSGIACYMSVLHERGSSTHAEVCEI